MNADIMRLRRNRVMDPVLSDKCHHLYARIEPTKLTEDGKLKVQVAVAVPDTGSVSAHSQGIGHDEIDWRLKVDLVRGSLCKDISGMRLNRKGSFAGRNSLLGIHRQKSVFQRSGGHKELLEIGQHIDADLHQGTVQSDHDSPG